MNQREVHKNIYYIQEKLYFQFIFVRSSHAISKRIFLISRAHFYQFTMLLYEKSVEQNDVI